MSELRMEISVWDTMRGDVIKKVWEATPEEYDDLVEQYRDEPWIDVVVAREWDEAE